MIQEWWAWLEDLVGLVETDIEQKWEQDPSGFLSSSVGAAKGYYQGNKVEE